MDFPDATLKEMGRMLADPKFQQDEIQILRHAMICESCCEKMRYIAHLTGEIKEHCNEDLK